MKKYAVSPDLFEKYEYIPEPERTDGLLRTLRYIITDGCTGIELAGVGSGFAVFKAQMTNNKAAKRVADNADELRRRLSMSKVSVRSKASTVYVDIYVAGRAYRLSNSLSECDGKFCRVPIGLCPSCDIVFHDFCSDNLLVCGDDRVGFVRAVIAELVYMYSPKDARFIIADGAHSRLAEYKNIPHMVYDRIFTDNDDVHSALVSLGSELSRRYRLLADSGCATLAEYNERSEQVLPRLFVVFNEYEHRCGIDFYRTVARAAKVSPPVGIHFLVFAPPEYNIVEDGTLQGFSCLAELYGYSDDRTPVLTEGGSPCGAGELLYRDSGGIITRAAVLRSTEQEAENLSDFLVRTYGTYDAPPQNKGFSYDPLVKEVLRVAIKDGSIATSHIQRRFSVGFARAARIMDYLEDNGYISPRKTDGSRDVYATLEQLDTVDEATGGELENAELKTLEQIISEVEQEGRLWTKKLKALKNS